MIQQIIIGTIFFAAVGYVAWLIYRTFQAKNACASGCGKCGAVDFEKIEKQLAESVNKVPGS